MAIPQSRSLPALRGLSWLRHGLSQIVARPILWIGGTLGLLVVGMALQLIPYGGALLMNLLAPALFSGFIFAAFRQEREGSFAWRDLLFGLRRRFAPLALLGAVILASTVAAIALSIAVAVGLAAADIADASVSSVSAAMGGALAILIALAVLSLITLPLLMAFWFAAPLVAFAEAGILDALKGSFRACWKNMFSLSVYFLFLTVLFLLALIPFGLGLILAIPIYFSSFAKSYSEIFGSEPLDAKPSAPKA